ncbi:DEAD/DEAH box helicase [Verrucomicrobiaceae bacterium R5-34]|nr:DEAD/DEAH box helicase [Verrucomicrobiaceae bacterium R5-34]
MPEVAYINQSGFQQSMLLLRQLGGAHQRAFNEACKIIQCLNMGADVSNKLTKHGETRIKHCVKYDISNDAHRLVTVHTDNFIYLLYVGTHEQTDKWLDKNKGLSVSLNKKSGRLTIVHETTEERRDQPGVNWETLNEANPPYTSRIGFDPSEYITVRSLVRAINRIDDQSDEDEINELIEDLEDHNPAVANLILDVLFEIRDGNHEAAQARIDLYNQEAIMVAEDAEAEAKAVQDQVNSDKVAVLTGLDEEQLQDLFSPHKFQEWMLFLHPDQKKIVDTDYERATILTGVSGSGKTCILVHRAYRLAKKYPNERIGVLTLNRSLSQLIANQVRDLCELQGEEQPSNLHVLAFYDYFAQLALHFGPDKELAQIKKIAESHAEGQEIIQAIDRVDISSFAREFDPISGETLDDTWKLFCDQEYVQTLLTYFSNKLWKHDDWVSPKHYLKEEFSLLRSAVPTINRENDYLELERKGRAIPLHEDDRKNVLDLLLLWEETMLTGGVLDELSLTQALVPHLREFKNLPPHLRFSCLLIDEFQDLSTRDLALLRLIPERSENGFFLAGDSVQRVLVKDLRLGAVGLDVISSNWHRIHKNYRNSKQILQAASLLAAEYGAQANELGQDLEVLDPELAVRETAWPVVVETTVGNEIATAWEYAQSCIQESSAAPWSICIVTANPELMSPESILSNQPTEINIPANQITGDYVRSKDSISVATMHDVKGFDFSLVIIVGCGEKQLPSPGHCYQEKWRDALRLYVAMTRARDEVRLIYSDKPSEFLTTMNEAIEWQELS